MLTTNSSYHWYPRCLDLFLIFTHILLDSSTIERAPATNMWLELKFRLKLIQMVERTPDCRAGWIFILKEVQVHQSLGMKKEINYMGEEKKVNTHELFCQMNKNIFFLCQWWNYFEKEFGLFLHLVWRNEGKSEK